MSLCGNNNPCPDLITGQKCGITYTGARYVPLFADPAQWDNTKTYEPLTIVLNEGNSYTSKTFVPIGIDINNTDFWAQTGNYNAQVEAYRQEVVQVKEDVSALNTKVNNIVQVNVKQFGAVGDGITDDTSAINAAIQSLDPQLGGTVLLTGTHLIKGTGAYLIFIDRPVRLVGLGQNTSLLVDSSVLTTTDIIRVHPSLNPQPINIFYEFSDFTIKSVNGTAGGNGISFNLTQTGEYVSNSLIDRMNIREIGGYCINLDNANQDGLFSSTIRNSYLDGGVNLPNIGDSVLIENNTITGNNTGIYIKEVNHAAEIQILNNNITADKAIEVAQGVLVNIMFNQIEQVLQSATGNAMIKINNTRNVSIVQNNINPHGDNIDFCIELGETALVANTKIDSNLFYQPKVQFILINDNAQYTFIKGCNVYINKSGTGTIRQENAITNNGIYTMGIPLSLPFEQDWTPSPSLYSGVTKGEGLTTVTINATKATTPTTGEVIARIPAAFAPTTPLQFVIYPNFFINITVSGAIQLVGSAIPNSVSVAFSY